VAVPGVGVRAGAGPGQEAEGGVARRGFDPARSGSTWRARPERGGPFVLLALRRRGAL